MVIVDALTALSPRPADSLAVSQKHQIRFHFIACMGRRYQHSRRSRYLFSKVLLDLLEVAQNGCVTQELFNTDEDRDGRIVSS